MVSKNFDAQIGVADNLWQWETRVSGTGLRKMLSRTVGQRSFLDELLIYEQIDSGSGGSG